MVNPFGLDPVGVLSGLLLAGLVGWTFTLYKYHQTLTEMERAQFWWEWWTETAVRHRIKLREDELDAAQTLMPPGSPPVADQVLAVADNVDSALQAVGLSKDDLPGDDDG